MSRRLSPLPFDDARHFVLLRALERADPAGQVLPLDLRESATHAASPPNTSLPATEPAARDFLARRVARLHRDLATVQPAFAALGSVSAPRGVLLIVLLALALGLGLAASTLGPSQRLQLLSFPLLGVVLWNLGAYAFLITAAFRPKSAAPAWLQRLANRRSSSGERRDPVLATARADFSREWLQLTQPLRKAELQLAWHLAAAVLALGLIGGLYTRGLVLEYRAGWESTFLTADSLAILLAVVLGPAAWLTGLPLPDAAELAPLAWSAGPGVNAAPWIHLAAVTAGLFVIGPRLLLAAVAAIRARHYRRALPVIDPDDPYLRPLLRAGLGESSRAWVLPLGEAPGHLFLDTLRPVATDLLGGRGRLEVLPPLAYGAALEPPGAAAWFFVAVDLVTTPEAEVHGEAMAAVRQARDSGDLSRAVVLTDARRHRERLTDAGLSSAEIESRVAARLAAWQSLAASHGLPLFLIDHPSLATALTTSGTPAPAPPVA